MALVFSSSVQCSAEEKNDYGLSDKLKCPELGFIQKINNDSNRKFTCFAHEKGDELK